MEGFGVVGGGGGGGGWGVVGVEETGEEVGGEDGCYSGFLVRGKMKEKKKGKREKIPVKVYSLTSPPNNCFRIKINNEGEIPPPLPSPTPSSSLTHTPAITEEITCKTKKDIEGAESRASSRRKTKGERREGQPSFRRREKRGERGERK